MQNVLNNIILIIISLGLIVSLSYLVTLADEKIKDERMKKAIKKLIDITTLAVNETNQSFVGALKDKGHFNEEDAKRAFNNTKSKIIKILDNETREILEKEFKNVDDYINALIEKKVKEEK